jgi:hypothetical protein
MMLFTIATRPLRRASQIALLGAAGLILGSGCSSQNEPAPAYPDPPPQSAADAPPADAQEPAPHGQPGAESPAPPPQHGQANPEAETSAHASPSSSDAVTDEEVSSFVSAYASIMELQLAYQEEFQQASSPEEAQAIEARAQGEVEEAIEDEGLSMQRFDEIARQLQTDPALQERVQQELGESGLM